MDCAISSIGLCPREEITGADFAGVLESDYEEEDPQDDFSKTSHSVEEYSEFMDWLSMLLRSLNGNRICEDRDANLHECHEEKDLES